MKVSIHRVRKLELGRIMRHESGAGGTFYCRDVIVEHVDLDGDLRRQEIELYSDTREGISLEGYDVAELTDLEEVTL